MSEYRVPAVVAAARILRELADLDGDTGRTQAELARSLEISKSSLHNLLRTLEAEGFVIRDPGTRAYRLGDALIPLGAAAGQRTSLRLAIDRLAPLATEHGLSFAIAQATAEGEAIVIERFYPPGQVHVGVQVGGRFGPFDGALGKCLLASMDPKRARRVVGSSRTIPAHTEHTITDPERLVEEVAQVRERGWASSTQELNENNAVAAIVPGSDTSSGTVFLLAIGFSRQLPEPALAQAGEMLIGIAEAIARDSGGMGQGGAGNRSGPPDE